MNYKTLLMYDMDYIVKEIDNIKDDELKEIIKLTHKFQVELMREHNERTEYEE